MEKVESIEESKEQQQRGNGTKNIFLNGAKSVAKVGEYPLHLISNGGKEVVKYVEKPVHTIRTWMKFTAVMLAAALLIWQLVDKIGSYVENPAIVNPEYSYVEKLPFPGVIICNSQPLRYARVSKNAALLRIINQSVSHPDFVNQSFSGSDDDFAKANKINMTQFYLDASQPTYDFIVGCKWPGGIANCSDGNFELTMTDYGPCYRLVIPLSKWPNMTSAGSLNSLQLVLNIDTEDSFPISSSETIGAFIALFPHAYPTPVVTHLGFNAPPSFETSISVTSEFVKRLAKDKKGSCIPKRRLVLFKNYTTTGCHLENQFIRRVNACSCLPYDLPPYRNPEATDEENLRTIRLLNSSAPCNAEQEVTCANQHLDDVAQHSNMTSCPEACEVQKYSSDLTYSSISGRQLRLRLDQRKKENITKNRRNAAIARGQQNESGISEVQYYKENFIVLNIFFKELVDLKIIQHLMYDGLNFAGDIAGTIGIILGFLLTTLGEVIDNCHMLYRKLTGTVAPEPEAEKEDEENEMAGKRTPRSKNDATRNVQETAIA